MAQTEQQQQTTKKVAQQEPGIIGNTLDTVIAVSNFIKVNAEGASYSAETAWNIADKSLILAEKKLNKALAEQELINAEYDAQLKETYGVSLDELVESIISKAHKRNK